MDPETIKRSANYWRAQAFLCRHGGFLGLAAQYEEYAHQVECDWWDFRCCARVDVGSEADVPSQTVSREVARLAVNIAFTGVT